MKDKYIAFKGGTEELVNSIAHYYFITISIEHCECKPVYEDTLLQIFKLKDGTNIDELLSRIWEQIKDKDSYNPCFDASKKMISLDTTPKVEIFQVPDSMVSDLKLDEYLGYDVVDSFCDLVELRKYGSHYECYNKSGEPLKTPKGEVVQTSSQQVGRKLMCDWSLKESVVHTKPQNMLSYQFVYQDLLYGRSKDDIIDLFDFLNWKEEWGLQPCKSGDPYHIMQWSEWMGEPENRIKAIMSLFDKCTPIQLSALATIFDEYKSFNVAFVLASLAQFGGKDVFDSLDSFYCCISPSGMINCDMYDFEEVFSKFRLFYLEGAKE